MYWLPLATAFSIGFGQLFKWAQRRGCVSPVVVSTNYLVLALPLIFYFVGKGRIFLDAPVLKVGAIIGFTLSLAMLVMTRGLEIHHVAPVLTAFRLAFLIPVVASVWLWREAISLRQVLGVLLAPASLMLMSRGKKVLAKRAAPGERESSSWAFCFREWL